MFEHYLLQFVDQQHNARSCSESYFEFRRGIVKRKMQPGFSFLPAVCKHESNISLKLLLRERMDCEFVTSMGIKTGTNLLLLTLGMEK